MLVKWRIIYTKYNAANMRAGLRRLASCSTFDKLFGVVVVVVVARSLLGVSSYLERWRRWPKTTTCEHCRIIARELRGTCVREAGGAGYARRDAPHKAHSFSEIRAAENIATATGDES